MEIVTKEEWEKFKKTNNKDQLIEMLNEQITNRDRAQDAYRSVRDRAIALENQIKALESEVKSGKQAASELLLEKEKELEHANQQLFETGQLLSQADREISELKKALNKANRVRNTWLPRWVTVPLGISVFLVVALFGYMVYTHGTNFVNAALNKLESITTVTAAKVKKVDPLAGMTFTKQPNGVLMVMDAHQETIPSAVWVPVTNWAKNAGFDCVVMGRIHDYGKPMLSGRYDLRVLADRLDEMGVQRAIAVVDNPGEFEAPLPIRFCTTGPLEIFESSKKVAAFIPIPWKKGVKLTAKNFEGFIDSGTGELNAKVDDFKMSVVRPVQNSPDPH